jgi:hypothetical protein
MSSPLTSILSQFPELADRAWRLMNLYTIRDADGILVPYSPNHGQRLYYNSKHTCNHILKARKLGFSTHLEMEMADFLLFNANKVGGIIDYTLPDAKKKLKMVKTAIQHLDNGDLHPNTWRLGDLIKKALPISGTTENVQFSNGSFLSCGTTNRGDTPNKIHVSELGKTALWQPIKAKEIIEGALNSITPGNFADIETTHEGGKIGDNYRLLNIAMRRDPATLSPTDFKFHFYAWFLDPRYTVTPTRPLRPEIVEYFTRLEAELNIHFTDGQKFWYDSKQEVQGHGMKKEYPSTPGEAFEAIIENAIYGERMATLRANGRIRDFSPEAAPPFFTFWDIGISDFAAIWLIQPLAREILVLDWYEAEGKSAAAHADMMRLWERKYNRPIAAHFLPHDAEQRDKGSGMTYTQYLKEAGIDNVRVVPRTPDVWLGVGHVRDVLPHCWFHKTNCDTSRMHNGTEFPSGVACLSAYSRDVSPRLLREMPKHDHFSHSCDAFRTFAEARHLGMLERYDGTARSKPKAIGGIKPRTRR